MNKQKCRGCRNDFYNGNNNVNVSECWSLKTAKIVWRIPVGNWECPPYKKKAVRVPSCYHTESQGTHYIKKESLNKNGCWK